MQIDTNTVISAVLIVASVIGLIVTVQLIRREHARGKLPPYHQDNLGPRGQ